MSRNVFISECLSNDLTVVSLVGYRHKVSLGADQMPLQCSWTPAIPPKTRIAIIFKMACGKVRILRPEAMALVLMDQNYE